MNSTYFAVSVIFVILWALWIYLRKRKPKSYKLSDSIPLDPLPLKCGFLDYLKAFFSWLFLFARVFSVKPGLYYTGNRPDNVQVEKTPPLVTCNNFLTVFLLARRIRPRNVRLLIIDTEEINVWCSSAKGRFSAYEIIEKASFAGLIKEERELTLILPKFSLAGVNLTILKKARIHPIIGPLYARDLPAYLDKGEWKNRINDKVHFGWQSRAFTSLPTAFQFLLYFGAAYVFTLGFGPLSMIWIAAALAFSYPLIFPYLPSRLFAVKGIFLGLLAWLLTLTYFYAAHQDYYSIIPVLLFLLATAIFVGLSYTGNSAVSNYSRVRREITLFLPLVIVLYLLTIPLWFLFKGY